MCSRGPFSGPTPTRAAARKAPPVRLGAFSAQTRATAKGPTTAAVPVTEEGVPLSSLGPRRPRGVLRTRKSTTHA